MGIAFIRVIGSAMGYLFTTASIELIPVSKAVVIIYNPFLASLLSFLIIGEKLSIHDLICFFFCTLGVIMLTDPFSESVKDIKEILGIMFAFLSGASYNISYIALRKIRDTPVSSWVLVLMIMVVNLVTMPAMFLTYDMYRDKFTHYTDNSWILLVIIGSLTLSTLYFANLTFYYEKAGRGAAYHNFELIFTYFFDVFYMKNTFKVIEILGASLIVVANVYLYILKSAGIIN